MALVSKEYDTLQSMMGDAFWIEFTGGEQDLITVNDAITLLQSDLLSGPRATQFDTSIDPAEVLSADITILNLLIANAHFSSGWGAQNADHAIVLVAEGQIGAESFARLTYAREGFANIALSELASVLSPTPITGSNAVSPRPRLAG